jgi:hypothetical protein
MHLSQLHWQPCHAAPTESYAAQNGGTTTATKPFMISVMRHLLIGPTHVPIFEQQSVLQNRIGRLTLSRTHLSQKYGNFVSGQPADQISVFPQPAPLMESLLTLKHRVMPSQRPFFPVQRLKSLFTFLMTPLLYTLVNSSPSLLTKSLMHLLKLQTPRHLANLASRGVSSSGPLGLRH